MLARTLLILALIYGFVSVVFFLIETHYQKSLNMTNVEINLQQVVSGADELSADDCLQLGFSKQTLTCSRCDELSKFDLEEVKESCLKCCQKSDDGDSKVKVSEA